MARFTTTIELHEANENNYKTLFTELAKESFVEIRRYSSQSSSKKNIVSRKEEYQREGNVTIQEVTDAVMRAAIKTGKKYSFTIIRNKPLYN